jgi:hypothetical protein
MVPLFEHHAVQLWTPYVAGRIDSLGAYDERIMSWLANWEPTTRAVIAGLITRANFWASCHGSDR